MGQGGIHGLPTILADELDAGPQRAKLGQALLMRDGCYECHGTVAQGTGYHGMGAFGPFGPLLAPHPMPFAAVLSQLCRPRDIMPAYSPEILSDQDADNICAYLTSIPTGKPASRIPVLRAYANSK
jgi:mono/diheme cytochrome c family protein